MVTAAATDRDHEPSSVSSMSLHLAPRTSEILTPVFAMHTNTIPSGSGSSANTAATWSAMVIVVGGFGLDPTHDALAVTEKRERP